MSEANRLGDETLQQTANYLGLSAFCILLGGGAGLTSLRYGLGTFLQMGPGFFPLAVSILLVCFGIAILALRGRDVPAEALHSDAPPQHQTPAEKAATLARVLIPVLGAILLFGLLIRPAGLLLSIFVVVFVSSFAHPGPRIVPAILLAAGAAIVSVLIFVVGLGLNLTILPWSV